MDLDQTEHIKSLHHFLLVTAQSDFKLQVLYSRAAINVQNNTQDECTKAAVIHTQIKIIIKLLIRK